MNSVLVVCSLALCMCIFSANALNMKEQLDFVSNYFNNLDQLGKSFRELAINSPPCLESVDILTEPLDENDEVALLTIIIDPRKCNNLTYEVQNENNEAGSNRQQYCILKSLPGLSWNSPLFDTNCKYLD